MIPRSMAIEQVGVNFLTGQPVSMMTAAIIGTGGIGSAIRVSLLPVARPSSSRAPTRSWRDSWPRQSAERQPSRYP